MQLNPNNPIVDVLKKHHITPEMLARIAYNMGYDSVNDFLSYFEPKQEYAQHPNGQGEGTTASQVEHYINLTGNNQHNPGQAINPLGFPSGGSPHNPISKGMPDGGCTKEIGEEESKKKKLPTGIKKKKKSSEQVGNTLGVD